MESEANEFSLLVVDENPAVLAIATAMLEPGGFRVLRARGIEEALELCDREYVIIDGALLDVILPGASGPELAGVLRQKRPGLPVLYMAAFEDEGVIRISLARTSEDERGEGESKSLVADAIRRALTRNHRSAAT